MTTGDRRDWVIVLTSPFVLVLYYRLSVYALLCLTQDLLGCVLGGCVIGLLGYGLLAWMLAGIDLQRLIFSLFSRRPSR